MSPRWMRALKFWQTRHAVFVWQVQFISSNRNVKAYLIADANQRSQGLRIEKIKPTDIHPQGPGAIQVRKHVRTCTIRAIYRDSVTGAMWIPLYLPKAGVDEAPDFYVQLTVEKPPVLSFISVESRMSLVRISSQGSFTKRMQIESLLPHDNLGAFENIINEVLTSFSPAVNEEPNHSENLSLPMDESKKKALQQIKRRIKTLKKSLKKELQHIPSEEDAAKFEKHARYLQNYAYLVKADAIDLTLESVYTGESETLSIPLNPDLSVGQNIEQKFILAKKARRAYLIGMQQAGKVEHAIANLEAAARKICEDDISASDLDELLSAIGIRKKATFKKNGLHQEQAQPYKAFESEGTKILVGKGAKENDELTKKAKGNDFWLHAVGVSGSHVIVEGHRFRSNNLPETIFRDAAILALHYSKLKGDMAGEVYFTRRSNIKKQKGMPPGLWNVEHSKSVFVRYSKDELDAVLQKAIL